MDGPYRPPGTADDTGVERGHGTNSGRPRWQKVIGIIGLLVLLGLAILLLGPGGGGHGPGRHAPPENQEQEIDTEDRGGHQPPPWVPDH